MTTYTYTARNIHDLDKVLTFTLHGDYLKINLTGLEDDLTEILTGKEGSEGEKKGLSSQVGPTALKVMESISGPIHISDVSVKLSGDDRTHFRITLWQRLAGLRAAPVVLDMGEIDNPSAAKRFVAEVEARKDTAGKISKFIGPLDYWLGWIGMAVLAFLMIRQPSDD
jgi:hypothetical protein